MLKKFKHHETIRPQYANDLIALVQFSNNELIFADRKGCCEVWRNDSLKFKLASFNSETIFHKFYSFVHSTGIKIYLAHSDIGNELRGWAPKDDHSDYISFDKKLSVSHLCCKSISLVHNEQTNEFLIKAVDNSGKSTHYKLIVDLQNGDLVLIQGEKINFTTNQSTSSGNSTNLFYTLHDWNNGIRFDQNSLDLSSVDEKLLSNRYCSNGQIDSVVIAVIYSCCETKDKLYLGHDGFISIWKPI